MYLLIDLLSSCVWVYSFVLLYRLKPNKLLLALVCLVILQAVAGFTLPQGTRLPTAMFDISVFPFGSVRYFLPLFIALTFVVYAGLERFGNRRNSESDTNDG